MEKKPERRGLGRGLSALMADVSLDRTDAEGLPARRPDTFLPVESLRPNPDQPRRDFSPDALSDLAASIRVKGIIQPLIVRRTAENAYEIVAGERRWRAAQIAQVHEVPVLIRDFSDAEVLEVALIENIQRADLNAIEEALAYRQLMDRFGHTQEKMAEALSKSRSHIANLLRLLNLPDEVQIYVREGKLSAGHARALITSSRPAELARIAIAKGMSVRQVEELVRQDSRPASGKRSSGGRHSEKDADTRALEADLSANLKMAVSIKHEPGGETGLLTIRYGSLDDLDLLCRALSQLPRDGSV
jgi:ParB family chromosome partitioning protein